VAYLKPIGLGSVGGGVGVGGFGGGEGGTGGTGFGAPQSKPMQPEVNPSSKNSCVWTLVGDAVLMKQQPKCAQLPARLVGVKHQPVHTLLPLL
jgi:hypothetical protein